MAMLVDLSSLDQVRTTSGKDSVVFYIKCCSNKDCDKFKFVNDLLYFQERLYIPKDSLCLKVLEAHYDFLTIVHFGFHKTLELISRNFSWL